MKIEYVIPGVLEVKLFDTTASAKYGSDYESQGRLLPCHRCKTREARCIGFAFPQNTRYYIPDILEICIPCFEELNIIPDIEFYKSLLQYKKEKVEVNGNLVWYITDVK